MSDFDKDDCAWCNSPEHVRPDSTPLTPAGRSRREFLYVGLVGGLGLTLGNYFGMGSSGRRRHQELREQGRRRQDRHPHLPARRDGAAGVVRPQAATPRSNTAGRSARSRRSSPARCSARTIPKIAHDRRQDHRRPLDDPRRGRPRARHAQHVHRATARAPRCNYPSMGSVVAPRVRPAEQPAAVRRHPDAWPTRTPAAATSPARTARSASAPTRPTASFQVRDLNLAKGVDDARFAKRRKHARRRRRPLPQAGEDRRARRDGLVLPAGVRADQLARQAREAFDLNAEPDATQGRVRPERRRHAHADVPPARRGGRAVRLDDLRRVGPPRQHQGRLPAARCRAFDQALRRADHRPRPARAARHDARDGHAASSAARPRSTRTTAATTGRRCSASLLAGGGIKRGQIYGSSDATASEPDSDPLTVEDLATTVYNQLGINADKELMAPGDRPIEIVDGGKVVTELLA